MGISLPNKDGLSGSDDFLILNDDIINIPKIVLVIIKIFYNEIASIFSLIIKTAWRTLSVFKYHELIASERASRHLLLKAHSKRL